MTKYRTQLGAALAAGLGIGLGAVAAQAGGTLTVGMTAGDLPVTTGNPDQGFEGYRFVGYNLYDPLVLWDLSGAGDKAADIKPASPPNGISTKATPGAGSSSCAKVSSGTTAARSPLTT
jgi:hypothetical protein